MTETNKIPFNRNKTSHSSQMTQCTCHETVEQLSTFIILVAENENSIEKVNTKLKEAVGLANFCVTCTPLRSYETYAEKILHVDPKLAKKPPKSLKGKDLFWMHIKVEYPGRLSFVFMLIFYD